MAIELTWKCHVCDDERPDQMISVYTTTWRSPDGIEVKQNVRYCNDRPACLDGATKIKWFPADWVMA